MIQVERLMRKKANEMHVEEITLRGRGGAEDTVQIVTQQHSTHTRTLETHIQFFEDMNRLALFRAFIDQSHLKSKDSHQSSEEAFQKLLEPDVNSGNQGGFNSVSDLCPAIQILDQECVESPMRSFLTNSHSFEKSDSYKMSNTNASVEKEVPPLGQEVMVETPKSSTGTLNR